MHSQYQTVYPYSVFTRPLTRKSAHTYLSEVILWSRRWFSQGEAQPLHSGCADPGRFSKCEKLDCIICVSGGLPVYSPVERKRQNLLRHEPRSSNPWFSNVNCLPKGHVSALAINSFREHPQRYKPAQVPAQACSGVHSLCDSNGQAPNRLVITAPSSGQHHLPSRTVGTLPVFLPCSYCSDQRSPADIM